MVVKTAGESYHASSPVMLKEASGKLVMPGLVPPAGPKPLRRGVGPGIHVLRNIAARMTWMEGTKPGHDGITKSP
jgi:hypothetical protein